MKRGKFFALAVIVVTLVFMSVFLLGFKKRAAETEAIEKGETIIKKEAMSDEEYVDVLAFSSLPMFVVNDFVGWETFGQEYGVKTTIAGPAEWDIDGQVKTLDEVVARKPAGIMVHGFSPALKGGIDRAIDAGIPTVCVDGDVPDSKRLSFIGTDWYQVGVAHARELARLIGGKGKVAGLLIIGVDIYDYCAQGYKDELAKYPDIELIGIYHDEADAEVAARITTDLVTSNPDLAGISVFDGTSPGVGAALKELDLCGKVKVTGMNVDPPMIKYLEDGCMQVLVGQRRALFTYYSGVVLYNYNHSSLKITPNDKGVGVNIIPPRIDTGIFLVTPENVKAFKGEM
jgi:ribose transport system substrate-binding protein